MLSVEEEDALYDAAIEALTLWEDQAREAFALRYLAIEAGVEDVDGKVRGLLERREVQQELQKALFESQTIRANVQRLLSKKRGERLLPTPKAN